MRAPFYFSTSLQVTASNVDIARVAPAYHIYTQQEVEEVISRLWPRETGALDLMLYTIFCNVLCLSSNTT